MSVLCLASFMISSPSNFPSTTVNFTCWFSLSFLRSVKPSRCPSLKLIAPAYPSILSARFIFIFPVKGFPLNVRTSPSIFTFLLGNVMSFDPPQEITNPKINIIANKYLFISPPLKIYILYTFMLLKYSHYVNFIFYINLHRLY